MGLLYDKHIVQTRRTKSEKVFEELFSPLTFEQVDYNSPLDYVAKFWKRYQERNDRNNSLNGKIWECIIITLLYREGLLPFYTQAKVAFVPNVEFDVLLYTNSRPISLSLKTSLRERYKQADLEAIALRYVHRRAKSYLLTLDPDEAAQCKEKVKSGDIIGIDRIIDCNTTDINDLIEDLKTIKDELSVSPQIDVVEGNLIQ